MQKRWQDWVMLVFGIWLFFSPFFLGYTSTSSTAAWNSYVLGVLVVIFALWALSQPQQWEEWINLVLGIWLIISPWVLQYHTTDSTATTNHVILGILIGADAIWALAQRPVGIGHPQH
jgi:hypothetical protein